MRSTTHRCRAIFLPLRLSRHVPSRGHSYSQLLILPTPVSPHSAGRKGRRGKSRSCFRARRELILGAYRLSIKLVQPGWWLSYVQKAF
jgi:hypothetical protein